MGYGFEFGGLAFTNVTFLSKATEILNHIPLWLKASRFCLFAYAQPAEVRLRSSVVHASLRSE